MSVESTSSSFNFGPNRLGSWHSTTTGQDSPSEAPIRRHFDLVTFLSVVQRCAVDTLALTWREGENPLGRGGTSIINSAHVNLRASFAFKRIVKLARRHPVPTQPTTGEVDQLSARYGVQEPAWRAVISELLVLCHPAVRPCANVVNVHAICWEIDDESLEPWPILVSHKSELGDLRAFRLSGSEPATVKTKYLAIVQGIANGVATLHENDIVHGDIKPENILVFEDDDGKIVPKITDFGYSTPSEHQSLVYMPTSVPWTAPERTHRPVLKSSAAKMDVFSFGLVCLWLLIGNQYPDDSWLYEMPHLRAKNTDVTDPVDLNRESSDTDDVLVQWAQDLIRVSIFCDDISQRTLELLMKYTIPVNAEKRVTHWNIITACLSGTTASDSQGPYRSYPDEAHHDGARPQPRSTIAQQEIALTRTDPCLHATFKISRDILELCRAHYRVRKSVAQALHTRITLSPCDECVHACRFQLSICYGLGFGVPRDEDLAAQLCKASGYDSAQLDEEIRQVRHHPRVAFENEELWRYHDQGYLTGIDLADVYMRTEDAEEIQRSYAREILDMGAVLGEEHILVQTLQLELGDFLCDIGNYLSAREQHERVRQITVARYGPDSPVTWMSLIHLASTMGHEGKWVEAVDLLETTADTANRVIGAKHMDVLSIKAYLASAYVSCGQLERAESTCLQILADAKQVVGTDHSLILGTRATLAKTLTAQGRLDKAEEVYREVVVSHELAWGPRRSETLVANSSLAMLLHIQGKLDEAEGLMQANVNTWKAYRGSRHPHTMIAISDLSVVLIAKGESKHAREVLEETIPVSIEVCGPENRTTIKLMSNLASALGAEGSWDQALEIQRKVVEVANRTLIRNGVEDRILYAINLVKPYLNLGRRTEAEKLAASVRAEAQDLFGVERVVTLKAMITLAGVYRMLGKWEETEVIEAQVVEIGTRVLGAGHPLTLTAMDYLAVTYVEQDRNAEAELLLKETLSVKEKQFGSTAISTLKTLNVLSRVFCLLGRLEDAEDLATGLVSIAMGILQTDHPFVLDSLSSLSSVYYLQGRGDEVAELMLEKFGVDVELSGEPEIL